MEKKRKMSRDKFSADGFIELTPQQLANMYNPNTYSSISYTVNASSPKRIVIDGLLNQLHEQMLQFIDDAVEVSDLAEAKSVIERIRKA